MGRYVYGDFEYKFAFGEQSSSLGEVLEEIQNATEGAVTVHRYFSQHDAGEKVEVHIEDMENFTGYVEDVYLKGFEHKTDEDWHLWSTANKKFGHKWHDQNMMNLFLKTVKENELDYLSLEIEY